MDQRVEPSVDEPATSVESWLKPEFTGSGAEYFKIWIVNLCLTVLTLGIYSAWAKVRRLQYFDRNTVLDGACFDFKGDPKAVLRGRMLAVGLALAYHYGFGFSAKAGLIVVVLLLLLLPILLRGALRFRLRNTSYRGLRLGFSGSIRQAYMAYLPFILLFVLPTILQGLDAPAAIVGLSALLWLSWPACHGLFKCYQHRHLVYGQLNSRTGAVPTEFYQPYIATSLMGTISVLGLVGVGGFLGGRIGGEVGSLLPLLTGVFAAYIAYLVSGPLLQSGIANLMWNQTEFDGVRFESNMEGWAFVKLQAKNVVLTLLSFGLYRPFAAVATYRYRLSRTTVVAMRGAGSIVAGAGAAGNAAGDGAADLLDFDISW
jgi:uncharacterized membrane protein YjgN (DUF898 family)